MGENIVFPEQFKNLIFSYPMATYFNTFFLSFFFLGIKIIIFTRDEIEI